MLLFEFIQSMSKSEKRYFKLFAQLGRKDVPKYVKLFDLLNKQSSFNEELLKKKGFNADDKNLLTEKVLDCVHLMKIRKTIDSELTLYLSCFPILYEKNQWGLLARYVRRAKKLAVENERFNIAIEINGWETNILFKVEKNELGQKMQLIVDELKEYQHKYNEILNQTALTTQLDILLLNDRALVKTKSKEKFKELFKSKLLSETNTPVTVRAKLEFYYTQCLFFRKQNNLEKVHFYYVKIIDLFNNNSFLFQRKENGAVFVKMVYWEKGIALKLGIPSHTKSIDIEAQIPNPTLMVTYNINLQELTYCVRTLNKQGGEKQIEIALNNWEGYSKYIKETRLAAFSNTIMVFYGIFEEWKQAEYWLQRVLSVTRVSDRKDVQLAARIWQLIISYELEPYELDKHTQSAFKFFVRNECYFEFEEQVIRLFRSLYKAVTKQEKVTAFQDMLFFFDRMNQADAEYKRGAANLKMWCESRATQTSIPELIKDYKRRNKLLTYF